MLYTLMHRDTTVMDSELDEYSNIVALGKIHTRNICRSVPTTK